MSTTNNMEQGYSAVPLNEAQTTTYTNPIYDNANYVDVEGTTKPKGIKGAFNKKNIFLAAFAYIFSAVLLATLSSTMLCCNWGCRMPLGFCFELCAKTSMWNIITLDFCTFVPCILCDTTNPQNLQSGLCSCLRGCDCCGEFCMPTLLCTDQEGAMRKIAAAILDTALAQAGRQHDLGDEQQAQLEKMQEKAKADQASMIYSQHDLSDEQQAQLEKMQKAHQASMMDSVVSKYFAGFF